MSIQSGFNQLADTVVRAGIARDVKDVSASLKAEQAQKRAMEKLKQKQLTHEAVKNFRDYLSGESTYFGSPREELKEQRKDIKSELNKAGLKTSKKSIAALHTILINQARRAGEIVTPTEQREIEREQLADKEAQEYFTKLSEEELKDGK